MPGHRLHEPDCGTMTLSRQLTYAMPGEDSLTIRVRAFVHRAPRRQRPGGLRLPLEAIENPSHWEWLNHATWSATPANPVRAQIDAVGIDPESILVVVQSHLHSDHIGGIGHFPDAEFLVHGAEWEYAHVPADWISQSATRFKISIILASAGGWST